MDGWVELKAVLWIAYSNQQSKIENDYKIAVNTVPEKFFFQKHLKVGGCRVAVPSTAYLIQKVKQKFQLLLSFE
jgi:hypothetical protein